MASSPEADNAPELVHATRLRTELDEARGTPPAPLRSVAFTANRALAGRVWWAWEITQAAASGSTRVGGSTCFEYRFGELLHALDSLVEIHRLLRVEPELR